MGHSDGDRLVSGDGASGVSQCDKAVAPNRCNWSDGNGSNEDNQQ